MGGMELIPYNKKTTAVFMEKKEKETKKQEGKKPKGGKKGEEKK